jgi:prepilin-type N-terminal cleavage/methylation domain-containing protein
MKRLRNRQAGFTLVELLVVIAIITVLIAIALPVFSRAREKARQTACMANLHQLAVAIRMYRMDMMRYPGFYDPATGAGGLNALYPAYVSDRGAFVCPDDPIDTGQKYIDQVVVLGNFNGSDVEMTYADLIEMAGSMYLNLWRDPGFFAEHYSSYNGLYNWVGYVGEEAWPPEGLVYSLCGMADQTLLVGDNLAFWYAWHRWDPAGEFGEYWDWLENYLHYHLAQQTYWYDYDSSNPSSSLDSRLTDAMGRALWDPASPDYYPYGMPSPMFPGLINRNAPDNTIITRCPKHRAYTAVQYGELEAGKDIVLRLDGSCKLVPGLAFDWATQPR